MSAGTSYTTPGRPASRGYTAKAVVIDALDGSIYRERSHSHAAGQVPKQSVGWAVDGICDGIGDAFRMVAMLFLLHRFLGSGPRFVLLLLAR